MKGKRIRYATLLKIIVLKFDVIQREFEESLGVDTTTISKYVRGKSKLKNELTPNVFQQSVFVEDKKPGRGQVLLDNKLCEVFYDFLVNNGFQIDSEIANSYNERCKQDGNRAFIQTLVKAANQSREDNIKGNGIDVFDPSDNISNANDSFTSSTVVSLLSDQISQESLSSFIGREDMLKEIEAKLNAHAFAIICGIGGMGKSKCAQKYAFDGLKSKKYDCIQQLYFETDLTTTMLGLRFYQNDDKFDTDEEHLEANLRLLSKIDEKTLLIIDNFDAQPDDCDKSIIKRLKEMRIHVLITTRNMEMDKEEVTIKISPLSNSEQRSLFEIHYGSLKGLSETEMQEIFGLTEGHTMLIELVAKTMREHVLLPDEMLESLVSVNDGDVGEISIDKDNEYENDRIYSYIAKLFNTTNIDEEGRKLLMQLSLSGVAGLRLRVLRKLGLETRVVQNLVKQSWIIRDFTPMPRYDRVHLHTAIRTAVWGSIKPVLSDLKAYIEAVANACKDSSDKEYTKEDKHDLRNIIKNAGDKFLDEYSEAEADLLYTQATILKDANESKASLESALSFYLKCIDFYEKKSKTSKSNQTVSLAELYVDCGDVSAQLSDYKKAIQYYQNGIELFAKGKDYYGRAKAYNKLANFYRKASNYAEAEKAFSTAKEMTERIVKKDELKVMFLQADILNNMGILYINKRDYSKAFDHYCDALHIRESLEKTERRDKELAYSYQNIGTVYQKRGDYENAIIWHEKALNLRKEVYGPNHQILSDSENMLGNDKTELVHSTGGKCIYSYEDAKKHLDKALKLRKEQLGKMHTSVAWSYQNIGIWHIYQGHTEDAIEYFQNCLQIRRDKLGNRHAYTAEALYWLGVAYENIQKEKARIFLLEAEDIQKKLDLSPALKLTRSHLKKLK